MPRHGENPLARLARAVAHEDGFSFGIPRLSDDGSRVTLPILRTARASHPCRLAADVSDKISAVDVGRIDRIQVRNDSDAGVFLPPGTIFEGRGTASRGTCAGVVLPPSGPCEIRVRCVEPDQAIQEGVTMRLATSLAPPPVTQSLLSLDQGLVWATVGATAERAADPGPAEEMSDARQCGAVLLDADGVVVAEILEDPESWRAVARTRAPVQRGTARLALSPANAVRVATEFLVGLPRRAFQEMTPESWVAVDASAAWTAVEDDLVHLIAFGRDLAHAEPDPSSIGPSVAAVEEELPSFAGIAGEAAAPDGSDVAVTELAVSEPIEGSDASPVVRPRRRKVLTSGWDGTTFESLERYSRKEFRGDRSAAIRFLVRHGLRQRGYMGPRSAAAAHAVSSIPEAAEPAPRTELGRAAAEARIQDLERIAETDMYAHWLRARARLELERLAERSPDEALRAAAGSALDRLPVEAPAEPAPAPEEIEVEARPAPQVPPPLDIRPLLRRAFAASAGGRYPEALTLFGEVLLAEPDNRTAHLGRAVALRRSGKAQEALDALDAVLHDEPGNAAALLNRGRILQERGDLTGALDAFELLAKAAPDDWDVWMARGDVLARMGRSPDALQAYGEALRRNPDDAGIRSKIRALEAAQLAPPSPASRRVPLPRDVQEGQAYLVRERRPDLSLRMVRAFAARAVPGLIITRMPLDQVRGDAPRGTRILELSHAPGEGHQDPTALLALTKRVEHFVLENHGHGVILLDGLGALVRDNGFRETILFIERVHDIVQQSHALFLVSVAPGDLGEKEAALLERDLWLLE